MLGDQAVSPDGQWLVASVAWAQDPFSDVLTTFRIGTNDNGPGLAGATTWHVPIEFHPDWQPLR